MVTSIPMVSYRDVVCSDYVLGKHHHDNFDKYASWHALTPVYLVNNDLCGPLVSTSLFGFKYFLIFIDNYFRHTWIYFLKLKSKVFNIFLAYRVLVEKQSSHQLLELSTDNGGSMVTTNSQIYTLHTTAFKCNTQFHIHHGKMV